MAQRALFLVALLAGACIALPSAVAQELLTANEEPTVDVTFYVEGTVIVLESHEHPGTVSNRATSRGESTPALDVYHTLVDQQADNTSSVSIRVDFGADADSLVTGDLVRAPITLQLPIEQAELIGMDIDGSSSFSFSSRRLLSEQHEAARRMVLDFHGTRRSVQEAQSLLTLLRSLQVMSLAQVPKALGTDILEKNADKDLFVVNGQPQNVSSLTFVFRSSSCGLQPNLTADRVRNWFYDSGDNVPVVATLQRYYNVCTYNQLTFRPENNLVFDVDIPCIGTTKVGPYDLKSGNGNGANLDNELYGLPELAKLYLQRAEPAIFAKWRDYRRKVFFYPFNWHKDVAGFAGLAMMGCAASYDCYTWMNNGLLDNFIELPVTFQELGHNIGLAHSARLTCNKDRCNRDEYGDPADPMGYTWANNPEKQLICTNAPQSYKAGWSSPISGGQLNALREMPAGVTREFLLPAMALNKNNHLRIVAHNGTTTGQPQRALFVSYRSRQPIVGAYDSGLRDPWNNRVWVHEYNETANGSPANYRTPPIVHTMLSDDTPAPRVDGWGNGGILSNSYTQLIPGVGGIRITFKSKTPQAATVTVCRFLNQSEAVGIRTCTDGTDNDCDGLVDMDDPDCNSSLQPPPTSQPPPPAPRPSPRPPGSPRRSPSPPPPASPRMLPPQSPSPNPPRARRTPPLQRAPGNIILQPAASRKPPSPPRTPHVPRPPRGPRPPTIPRPPRSPRPPSTPRPPRPPPRK